MKLTAKILPKYLDQLLSGVKKFELRQFESITLTDGTRSVEFDISFIEEPPEKFLEEYKQIYSDVKWDEDKPVYVIRLGKLIKSD
jgi:hypothetical protein